MDSFRLILPFENEKENQSQHSKKMYEDFSKGIIDLSLIRVGKKHKKIQVELDKVLNNPLLPQRIQDKVLLLSKNMTSNGTNMGFYLKKHLQKLSELSDVELFDSTAVYNGFNRQGHINNQKVISEIEVEIRKYLHVDDAW